jgi:polar amino acid transport system substrate-binding protein
MKRTCTFFVFIVSAAVLSCSSLSERFTGLPVIVFGVDAAWPPMEFVNENRELSGFDIELAKELSAAGSFRAEFRNIEWDRLFSGLSEGSYDAVISCVAITDERRKTMDFSAPYFNNGQVLVVRSADTGITGLEDLANKKMGAQTATTGAMEITGRTGIDPVLYDETFTLISALASGDVDGIVIDHPTAVEYVHNKPRTQGKLRIVGTPFTEEPIAVAVRKGDAATLKLINAGLERVRASGKMSMLEDRWLRGSGQHE